MQWFINIINELIDIKCAANKVLIHSQLGAFDRGDPPVADWTVVDFVANAAWHDLDCSAIVPPDAQCILFSVEATHGLIGKIIFLRKRGNVNSHALASMRTQLAGISQRGTLVCFCDSDRFVQYKLTPPGWATLNLTICGWWLR